MVTDSAAYLSKLHGLIDRTFSLGEIRTLCFNLGVDYDSVAGEEKQSRIRELLLVLGRNGRLPELVALAQQERPHIDWPPVPADLQLPAALPSGASAAPVNQYNFYGDVVGGDKVSGDQVSGDQISVGDISGSSGIAIGREASVHIQQGPAAADLEQLFTPLLVQVAQTDPPAVAKVQALKAEVGRGEGADDEKMADLINEIAAAAPAAGHTLTNLFANPAIANIAGGATNYVLKRIGN